MKQAERVAKTKASLIEAFWKLYRKKPLDQISVREITDAAGVYRSTFYLYFQDAPTVLAQLEDELEGRLAELLDTAAAKSSLEDIPALMALFYKKEGGYLYPLLGPDGDRAFAERVFALIRPAIEDTSELCDQDFEMAFRFACEGSLGLVASCYKQRRKTPLEEVAEAGRALIAGTTPRADGLTQSAESPESVLHNSDKAEYEPISDLSEADALNEASAKAEQAINKPARKSKKAASKPKPKPAPKPATPVEQAEDDDVQMALF